MKYKDLAASPIRFDEAGHTYSTEDGFLLTGVTSVLKSVLFSDKYVGVPEDVLRRAAEYGTKVHAACQLYDIMGDESDLPELERYKVIKEENGINMIAAEYLVSDGSMIATMIDCIDENGNLYDIKTTYSLDEEYLSWQLSFCARLFELQNPTLKAGKLYAIWLRTDRHKLVEVPRRSDEELDKVIKCYLNGETLTVKQEETTEIARVADIEANIIAFKKQVEALESEKQLVLDRLKSEMEANGLKKIETDRVLVTIVPDSASSTFDSKKFKEDHPDMAASYMKTSSRKGYVKITLRS